MTRLKMKSRMTHYVDYNDLQNFINQVYGVQNYSIQASEYMSNDSETAINVSSIDPLDEWDLEMLKEFKVRGHKDYILSILMQDMVNRATIPAGRYVIET